MNLSVHLFCEEEPEGLPGLSVLVSRVRPFEWSEAADAGRRRSSGWEPTLAPSAGLGKALSAAEVSQDEFVEGFRAEMQALASREKLRWLAGRAQEQRLNIGCGGAPGGRLYCAVLRELVVELANGGNLHQAGDGNVLERFSSPACAMPEIED